MTVTDELLAAHARYAETSSGPLPLAPSRRVAVGACIDARLDVHRAPGLSEGEGHVIRDADGVVTDDETRSPAISQRLLGTREVVLVHHTDCGMLTVDDEDSRASIGQEVGTRLHGHSEAFPELEEDVRVLRQRILDSPFVPVEDSVRGSVSDVATGELSEVHRP
ncbi:beta-class carbonic anhydrase [Geodermatophilus sp. SYSU D00697]